MKSRIALAVALLFGFVLGLASFHPIAAAMTQRYSSYSCSGSGTQPCYIFQNTGAGPGISSSSAQGNGLLAWTNSNNSSPGNAKAGLWGQDNSTAGTYNAGVLGTSTLGTGLKGTSSSGDGVYGAASAGGTGVFALSKTGYGLSAQTLAATGAAIKTAAPKGARMFDGRGPNPRSDYVVIDGGGNIHASGQIYTAGSCSSGCAIGRVESYGTTAAAPTIEDTGEARLRGGVAFVRLDPAFANVIDPNAGYVVLLTPEGDTRGLFVAQRAAAGFAVREMMGGRSTIPFAYRIVAHPFGVRAPRLPLRSGS